MRITQGMLVQQAVQAAKNEGIQKAEVGAAITARISEVLNGVLTLDVGNGKQMVARDLSGQNFYPGQTVTFEVVGYDEGGTLQVRLAANESVAGTDTQKLAQMLKSLNLPDTEGNRELIKNLSAYRIPLNPENIKAAQELNVQAKGIVQLTDKAGTAVLAEHEAEPIKQIAARLIEITGTQVKTTSPEPAVPGRPSSVQTPAQTIAAQANPAADTEVTPQIKLPESTLPVTEKVSVSANIPNDHTEKNEVSKPQTGQINTDTIKPSNPVIPENKAELKAAVQNTANATNESPRGEELKELLKQLTFEKIGFVLKTQLPADLGTLNTLDKLILGKKELGVQLKELLGNLPNDEVNAPLKEAIQNAVKAVHIHQGMDAFELQKQLKSLNQTLTSLSLHASESVSVNQNMKESLTEVKNSLDFLGRLSESATYLHVPVMLGQGTKPMDLYVQRDKSGKKKVNPNDTRIFISLDTNHMNTVQCLVEVQEKKLNIGFKLADPDALAIISRVFDSLKEALAQQGYTDVNIHGTVYQKPLNLMDITKESPLDLRRIDMRV